MVGKKIKNHSSVARPVQNYTTFNWKNLDVLLCLHGEIGREIGRRSRIINNFLMNSKNSTKKQAPGWKQGLTQ